MFPGASVDSQRVIYTPSAFAKENLIYLQEVGKLKALKPHTSRRSGLKSYLFFVVTEGEGILEYEDKVYSLSKGTCVFIDCKSAYSHTSSKDYPWTLKWIHFNGESMKGIYEKYCTRGGMPVFSLTDFSAVEKKLDNILITAGSDDYIRDMKLNEEVTSVLTLIMAESWHPEYSHDVTSKRRSLSEVTAYLEEHYSEKISLDMLANTFYINKYYLTRIFKDQYEMTIMSYLDHLRITQAKELLRFTDLSVEEVGRRVGIEEPGYFNRVFKKIENISPGEYRKLW